MMAINVTTPRIVIHGSGNVARRLFDFCRKKGWPVVGVFNRRGDKVGQDVGRLFGLGDDIGLRVQDIGATDSATLSALLYERYLSAGINVLCHGTQSYNPRFENPEIAAKIDRLAKAKGVTFTAIKVGNLIRESRLQKCRAALRNPALLHQSIVDIAMSWGFCDATSFSRSYKARFGLTPRDERRTALA